MKDIFNEFLKNKTTQALTARIAELEAENKNLRDRIEASGKPQVT